MLSTLIELSFLIIYAESLRNVSDKAIKPAAQEFIAT